MENNLNNMNKENEYASMIAEYKRLKESYIQAIREREERAVKIAKIIDEQNATETKTLK